MTEQKSTTFGPNAGLVDEMYERYRADPSSVAESWRDFFADYGDGDGTQADAQAEPEEPGAKEPEEPEPKEPEAEKKAASKKKAEAPKAEKKTEAPKAERKSEKKSEEAAAEPADEGEPIRGAAARIVANMEASLAVPTATSVPTLSNRSTNRNTNTISRKPRCAVAAMLSWNAVAVMSAKE